MMTTRRIASQKCAGTDTTSTAHSQNNFSVDSPTPAPITSALPIYYTLPPTVPSPFTPTLEASLDELLNFAVFYPPISNIITILLQPPSRSTNWPALLRPFLTSGDAGHKHILDELLFLLTRTLLPNQIAENRVLLTTLYTARKATQMRLLLRYDMLRAWKKGNNRHIMCIMSPIADSAKSGVERPELNALQCPVRRRFMPNVITTLVAAPYPKLPHGYGAAKTAGKMKHHVTALDDDLLSRDEEVAMWAEKEYIVRFCDIVLNWQWLRENNQILEDMSVMGWDGLQSKEGADWFLDM